MRKAAPLERTRSHPYEAIFGALAACLSFLCGLLRNGITPRAAQRAAQKHPRTPVCCYRKFDA